MQKNYLCTISEKVIPFPLGQIFVTQAIQDVFEPKEIADITIRYTQLDFGELSINDIQANNEALAYGGRILGAYVLRGERVYIITEADRSATTILMAYEY